MANPLVKAGSRGSLVITVRERLAAWGYQSYFPGDANVFDAALAQVVSRFQQDHGLRVDGEVGPQTWPALLSPPTAQSVDLSHLATGPAPKVEQEWVTLPGGAMVPKTGGFPPLALAGALVVGGYFLWRLLWQAPARR